MMEGCKMAGFTSEMSMLAGGDDSTEQDMVRVRFAERREVRGRPFAEPFVAFERPDGLPPSGLGELLDLGGH